MNKSDDVSLFSFGSTKYDGGTLGIVEAHDPDRAPLEGIFNFVLDYSEAGGLSCSESRELSSSTTQTGLEIYSSIEEGTVDPSERGIGDLAIGEKSYTYCVQSGEETAVLSYLVAETDEDRNDLVQLMVETVEFI